MNETSTSAQYYFCYGLDMSESWVSASGVNAAFVDVARLPGFRLGFYGHSRQWDGAEEALVSDPAGETWGVVYRVGFVDADALDSVKDIRLNGTGSRFHFPVDVFLTDGRKIAALFYQKDALGAPRSPSREYLALVAAAARARGLPAEYAATLARLESIPASYPVPRIVSLGSRFRPGYSCDCGA